MEQDTPARLGAIAQTLECRLSGHKLNDSNEPDAPPQFPARRQ